MTAPCQTGISCTTTVTPVTPTWVRGPFSGCTATCGTPFPPSAAFEHSAPPISSPLFCAPQPPSSCWQVRRLGLRASRAGTRQGLCTLTAHAPAAPPPRRPSLRIAIFSAALRGKVIPGALVASRAAMVGRLVPRRVSKATASFWTTRLAPARGRRRPNTAALPIARRSSSRPATGRPAPKRAVRRCKSAPSLAFKQLSAGT
jgi:hypothetical protein